jgi:formylglycine-generating enzyme required for sulfatase activity
LAATYFDYPTVSNTAPSNTLPDPGNHANFYDSFGTGNNNYTIGSPYYRTEAGVFLNSASPYGTFDQGGNVFEWNETKVISTSRGLRGGSFDGNSYYLKASNRYYITPTLEDYGMGFRVASTIPEPSTLLLVIAAFATLLTVRRKPVPHNRA